MSNIAASAQPGILQPLSMLGRSLTFDLTTQENPRAALVKLQEAFKPDWGIVGLGLPLLQALEQNIAGLQSFPSLEGVGCKVPSTQQALWVLLRADDHSTLFERTEKLKKLLDGSFILDDALDTFRYRDSRDLSGYIDGTENPTDDAAITTALVADGEHLRGSSFVAVQRWVHDLQRFHSFPAAQQDATIGRRRQGNEEIEDAPESAHVKRTAQESFTPEAFMLRRSMPWDKGITRGFEFIAFGNTNDSFERSLRRMVGLDDGIVDALFTFTQPITGGYFWCPPIKDSKLNLHAIGI